MSMKICLQMGGLCAVLVACGVSQAAQLSMSGVVTAPTNVNTPFSFVLDYVPSTGGSAAVNGGTLTLGTHVWNTVLGGTNPSITVVTPNGATKANALQISVQFSGPSSPGPSTGAAVTFLSFNIGGTGLDTTASLANITAIRNSVNAASGTLFITPNAPFGSSSLVLQGAFSSVPEPGLVGLLSIAGCAVVYGRYRRLRISSTVA